MSRLVSDLYVSHTSGLLFPFSTLNHYDLHNTYINFSGRISCSHTLTCYGLVLRWNIPHNLPASFVGFVPYIFLTGTTLLLDWYSLILILIRVHWLLHLIDVISWCAVLVLTTEIGYHTFTCQYFVQSVLAHRSVPFSNLNVWLLCLFWRCKGTNFFRDMQIISVKKCKPLC